MYKRIISFVLVIAILFCFAAPNAFAATEYRSKAVTYGEAYLTYLYNNADDVWNEDSPLPWLGTAIKGITTALNSKICEQSHDGYHANLGESISHEAFGMDEHGRYCLLSCDYCGEWFRCYSSDLIAAHDEYVASLDSTTVNNISSTYISYNDKALPNVDTVWTDKTASPFAWLFLKDNKYYFVTGSSDIFNNSSDGLYAKSSGSYNTYLLDVFTSSWDKVYTYSIDKNYSLKGSSSKYLFFSELIWSCYDVQTNVDGSVVFAGSYGSYAYPATTRTGSLMQTINNYNVDNSLVDNSSNVNYYIAPKSYVTELTDNSIDIEECTSPAMYDEDTLVFTLPGSDYQILTTGWTYDYTTRTYDISVAPGTTTADFEIDITRIVITYGDDTVYLSFYLEDGTLFGTEEYAYVIVSGDENFGTGGSSGEDPEDPDEPDDPGEDPEEETHKHSYTSTVTTEPTCEAPGIRKYTCSECGDSYTEKISAAGHTWTVKQTIATQYDDTGSVTVQGYTIYKCTTCNTEYKDDAGTGPPNTSGSTDGDGILKKIGQLLGSILSGLLGMIEAVLGGLLDGLVRLSDLVSDKLTQVVDIITGLFDKIPQLFGGFTALLGEVFAFIPEDIMTIFTFGAAAIVFVAILLLIIKR